MQDQVLALQEMSETSVDAKGEAEVGVTGLGSLISVFSDCTSIGITIY